MRNRVKQTTLNLAIAALLLGLLGIAGCGDDDKGTDSNTTKATINGTVTLPAAASGKTIFVILDNDIDGGNGVFREAADTCTGAIQYEYSFANVTAGTYFVYAGVYVSGETSGEPQPGDYLGIYGGTLEAPPAEANAVVPSTGTVTFDIDLEVVPDPS
jgi:hypothetical protein